MPLRRVKSVGVGVAAVGCALFSPIGPAVGFDGIISENHPMGTCNINYDLDTTIGTARIRLTSIGDHVAGGSLFSGNTRIVFTAISLSDLASCGMTNVSGFTSNGADGTVATDNYMGFSFVGTYGGVERSYEYAFSGQTATTSIFTAAAVDSDPPTVTLSGAPTAVNSTSPFPVTATFNETVTGLTAGEISATNATVGLSGSGTTYTLTVTPTGAGNITLSIPAGSAQDGASNDNLVSNVVNVTYDATAPTVAISGVPAVTNGASAFTATFTFSEAVSGFDLSDISAALSNATASNFAGGPTVYTATITPNGAGDVVVGVNSAAAQDSASNANLAATGQTTTLDATAPTITSITPSTTRISDGDSSFALTIVFSEAMDTGVLPTVALSSANGDPAITLSATSNGFVDGQTFVQNYSVADANQKLGSVDVAITGGRDQTGNTTTSRFEAGVFSIAMDLDIVSRQLQQSGARLLAQSAHRGSRHVRNIVQNRFRSRMTGAHGLYSTGSIAQGNGGQFFMGADGSSLSFGASFFDQRLAIPLLAFDKALGTKATDNVDLVLLQRLGLSVYATGGYETGEDLNSYYISTGVDRHFGTNTMFGVVGTYERHVFDETALNDLGKVTAEKDGVSLTAYGSHILDELLSFQGALSYGRFETNIALNEHLGKFDSSRWSGFIQATLHQQFGNAVSFSSLGTQALYETSDAYDTEPGAEVEKDRLNEWDFYFDQQISLKGLNFKDFRFEPYVGGTFSFTQRRLRSQDKDENFADVDLKLGLVGETLLASEWLIGYQFEAAYNDLGDTQSLAFTAGIFGGLPARIGNQTLKYNLNAFNTLSTEKVNSLGAKFTLKANF
ncbi:Ig-like domain-containing protein [Roseibium sediminis]|uniref:Ig-like domain-containing protein n=1 Tax=Roseibium sediminis TaxID=1775174 RepID=UPI00123E2E76|nr:Ig-like domain-containing protein [Roseibium sediminis]